MQSEETSTVSRLTDPRALRALAHPTRLTLLGLLRLHGPLTATKAGELPGEFSQRLLHLRQLAGDPPRGGGRRRDRTRTTLASHCHVHGLA